MRAASIFTFTLLSLSFEACVRRENTEDEQGVKLKRVGVARLALALQIKRIINIALSCGVLRMDKSRENKSISRALSLSVCVEESRLSKRFNAT